MKKSIKALSVIFLLCCVFNFFAFATETKDVFKCNRVHDLILDIDKIKERLPFKKKNKPEKIRMVETRQEWEVESKNVPLELRKIEKEKPKEDKNFYTPEKKYKFEKYNYPQGKRDLNLEDVKKKSYYYSYLVCDIKCHYAGYSKYYYSPDANQLSSEFYVEKLDTSKNKTRRILDYNHKQKERTPVVSSGMRETYPNLFSGLTLVDWSNDSKKLLIKEKVGSTFNGIYKTYLYVHFVENEIESGRTIKLDDFDMAIKNYFLDYQNIQIVKYRYDIEPLGFSADDDNVIIAHCFVYDNENKKIFMGTWGYDVTTRESYLISSDNPVVSLSTNGLILKEVIE